MKVYSGVGFGGGLTSVNMLRIRVKNAPIEGGATYYDKIIVNNDQALKPNIGTNPNRTVGIGEVIGIPETVHLTTDDTFEEAVPVVKNRFNDATLVKDSDYTVTVDKPSDMTEPGTYIVTYTITSKNHLDDVKIIKSTVNVVLADSPNLITKASSTVIKDGEATFTFEFTRKDGTLYLVILPVDNAEPTPEEIKNNPNVITLTIDANTEEMTQAVTELSHVYAVVENEHGISNVAKIENVDEVYHITTIEQLNDMVNRGSSDTYVLDNDVDGFDYEWIPSTTKFKGTFDGQNHVISNINIETAGYGGLFYELENATVKNIIFRNIKVTQGERGGVLAGQSIGSTIENITIYDSKVTSTGQYSAILIGRIRNSLTTISNIFVRNSEVFSTNTYVGGLIGYVESGSLDLADVYIEIKATEEHTSGQLVGGVIGRVNTPDKVTSVEISRVFAIVELSAMKNVGGIIGKVESGTNVSITDAVVKGTLSSGNSNSNSVIGNGSATLTNVWDAGVTGIGTAGQGVPEGYITDLETITNETWWQENMPNIAISELWTFVEGLPVLINGNSYKIIHIKTIQDLNDMAKSGSSDTFVLDNDIDGTDFNWETATTSFKGTFDGQGYTIKNLNIIAEGSNYGGLFKELKDAVIRNIVFKNIQVTQAERGGVLAGQSIGSVIDNIEIYDSKVTSANQYTAILIGRVRDSLTIITDIYVVRSEVYSASTYVGGLIGYVETGSLRLTDVYIEIKVTEAQGSGQLVGGLIGRVNTPAKVPFVKIDRVYAKVELLGNKNIGGLIGKVESITVDDVKVYTKVIINDAVVTGSIAVHEIPNEYVNSIVGNGEAKLYNVWDAGVTGASTNGQGAPEGFVVTADVINEVSWWQKNIPNIYNSEMWDLISGNLLLE